MNQETKTCQNCKKDFVIEPDDFAFYEKIKVPPPTWCPECRTIRRMSVSNDRSLYKVKCDLCDKDTISMYHKDKFSPVYCIDCWRSDKWDGTEYGVDYDFSKPFFQQIFELKKKVPRVALIQQGNMVDSEYTNRASNDNNCYLVFRANFNENVLYSNPINNSKDCIDDFNAQKCELSSNSIDCFACYNTHFSQECKNCNDSYFLYNCRNCSSCFGCVNLRNQQYHIFNKSYSKEEYLKKIEGFSVSNYENLESFKVRFKEFIKNSIYPYQMSINCTNSSGNWLEECKNVLNGYACRSLEDSKYVFGIIEAKDCMDYFYFGRTCELIYETSNCGYNSSNILFSNESFTGCSNLQYCDACVSISDCFGCVGLRNKQYCILNKQYTKEEYEELIPKIMKHMDDMPYKDKQGRIYKYGEFFPPELSPFCYNETIAQEYFPLTKDEAIKQGYSWKDPEQRNYQITIKAEDLPDNIKDVKDSITNEIIGCEHQGKCNEQCTTAFKIIPQELQFYKRMNLPLPRLCPNCRHYSRLKQRNPLKLWKRKCMCKGKSSQNNLYQNTSSHQHGDNPCPNEFQTSYSPERPETVYCEQCYNSEVA